jgi:hypothetical protein
MKKALFLVAACVTVSASGCATAPTGTYSYNTENLPASEISVIRPANQQERQYKPSAAARIFSVPAGIARLDFFWPANDMKAGRSIAQYESIRVSPGSYLVKAICNIGGFTIWYDLPIEAKAGKTHLIECTGATASRANITTREIDGQ